MNTNIEAMVNKYKERYNDHDILSQDILDEEKEANFFTQIRFRLK